MKKKPQLNIFSILKLAIITGFISGALCAFIEIMLSDLSLMKNISVLTTTMLFYAIIFVFIFISLSILYLISKKSVLPKFFFIRDERIFLRNLYLLFGLCLSILLLFYYLLNVKKIFLYFDTHPNLLFLTDILSFVLIIIVFFLILRSHIQIIKDKKKENILTSLFYSLLFFLFVGLIISFSNYYMIEDTSENLEPMDKPNILFITMDTVRADHLSFYGYEGRTSPVLDIMSESSVLFNNAISQSPWTLPSHSSMFTGLYPSLHGATKRHRKLNESVITLAEILREKGYNTAGFVGGPYCKAYFGIGQGFNVYKDQLDQFNLKYPCGLIHAIENIFGISNILVNKVFNIFDYASENRTGEMGSGSSVLALEFSFRNGEKSAEEINKQVFSWLDKNHEKQFFIFINYFDAHAPYYPQDPFRSKFTNSSSPLPPFIYSDIYQQVLNQQAELKESRTKLNESEIQKYQDINNHAIDLYDAEILYLDYHIGKLFLKLKNMKLLENTIIIVTADHGEEFLDHGGWGHGKTLYDEQIRVPLIIFFPKILEPQTIENEVELIDLMPTILDMVGFINETPIQINGENLLPLIFRKNNHSEKTFSELRGTPVQGKFSARYDMEAIRNKKLKLIETTHPKDINELFDLETDPEEDNNIYEIDTEKRELLQLELQNFKRDNFHSK